jgi:hypothetical protein
MNDEITGGCVRRRVWPQRAVLPIAMVSVAVALLATACSGGGSDPSASSTTGTTAQQKELAFAECVRQHGVPNFPDPSSDGAFGINAKTIGVSQSVLQTAQNACVHLMPNGGVKTPAEEKQDVQDALKYVQCMRTHGEPDFPDPTVSDGKVSFEFNDSNSLDPHSSQFQTALSTCQGDLANSAG